MLMFYGELHSNEENLGEKEIRQRRRESQCISSGQGDSDAGSVVKNPSRVP